MSRRLATPKAPSERTPPGPRADQADVDRRKTAGSSLPSPLKSLTVGEVIRRGGGGGVTTGGASIVRVARGVTPPTFPAASRIRTERLTVPSGRSAAGRR